MYEGFLNALFFFYVLKETFKISPKYVGIYSITLFNALSLVNEKIHI